MSTQKCRSLRIFLLQATAELKQVNDQILGGQEIIRHEIKDGFKSIIDSLLKELETNRKGKTNPVNPASSIEEFDTKANVKNGPPYLENGPLYLALSTLFPARHHPTLRPMRALPSVT